jgi:hypothetical protein
MMTLDIEENVMRFYGLCDRDNDCERGYAHSGACGPKHPDCAHRGACNLEYEVGAA